MRSATTNVLGAGVPGAGHWLMKESPAFTIALTRDFLNCRPQDDRVATVVSETITGVGPSSTSSVDTASAPRRHSGK